MAKKRASRMFRAASQIPSLTKACLILIPWVAGLRAVRAAQWCLNSLVILAAICLSAMGDGQSPMQNASPTIVLTNPPPWTVPQRPKLRSEPTTEEIMNARFFEEPLIPVGGAASQVENAALANALTSFANRTDADDFSALENYLDQGPNQHWSAAVEFNLGLEYYNTGYYSKALEAWENAWFLLKDNTGNDAVGRLAGRTVGELAKMHARIGDFQRLQEIFTELGNRHVSGPGTGLLSGSRQALDLMLNTPGIAFRCGPLALRSICRVLHPPVDVDEIVLDSASSQQGFSLSQLEVLSQKLKLNFQMAKRASDAPFITPSVVHWRVGHYAAILAQKGDRYLVVDPTFGQKSKWISRKALDSEVSGYFLIPAGALTNGWRAVTKTEGQSVWGKGVVASSDPNDTTPEDEKADPGPCDSTGMAVYSVHLLLVSLNIEDTPLSFQPPRGPAISLKITYNQQEANQPANFTYSNFGQKWACNWVSYLTDNSTNTTADVDYYSGEGGTEVFNFDSGIDGFDVQWRIQASLVRLTSSSYQMTFPDGSVRIFSQPDGTVGSSRKVFLTQVIDPTGYTNILNYDASLRLVSVTDPQAGLTNLAFYYNSNPAIGSVYTIQQVTDRYGRLATFGYGTTSLSQLQSSTDVLGITSQYYYDPNDPDFINALQTPYGTSTFTYGDIGSVRWLEATDPQGNTSRVEFNQTEDTGIPSSDPGPIVPETQDFFYTRNFILYGRNTFYWDKLAWAEAPGDYSKAKLYHWLHNADLASAEGVLESVKEPLENRVWFNYPGQTPGSAGATIYGTLDLPSVIARVLDDGDSQYFQFYRNGLGKITNAIDPAGRSITFIYASNQIDLLQIRQTTGTNNQLLASFTYNAQHLPLSYTDASGQTTRYTYNAFGQILGITNALSQVTTFSYSTSGNLLSIALPALGTNNTTMYFGHDIYDRVSAITNVDGYWLTIAYDAANRITTNTFPDGTTEVTTYKYLDTNTYTDRGGRVSQFAYDSLRHLTQLTIATNWTTYFNWCNCGSLSSITDPLGHITQWVYDIQGRVIGKQYDDGSGAAYTYETATSRLQSFTNERQQTRTYYWYDDDNLNGVVFANPEVTPTLILNYDSNFNRLALMQQGVNETWFGYYPITSPPTLGAGRLAYRTNQNAYYYNSVNYVYDPLGRVQVEMLNNPLFTVANGWGPYVYEASNTFDALGRTSAILANGIGAFNYNYVGATPRLATILYPGDGESATFDYYTVQGNFWLKDITNAWSSGPLSRFSYAYNLEGQITNWIKQFASQTPQTNQLLYDAIGEITNDTIATAGSRTADSYSYDFAGNRTLENVSGNASRAWFGPLNQILGKDQGISSTNRSYQWDEENRLVAITNGSATAQMSYDAFGHCVALVQRQNGNIVYTHVFTWSLGRIIEEGFITNELLLCNWYYPEGFLFSNDGSPEGEFVTRDHLGSVRELTDASGNLDQRADYDPFGRYMNLLSNTAVLFNFGFSGFYSIPGVAQDMATYRLYDPDLGRWLSRDPIGEAGGLNLYSYAANDPIDYVDADGLCPEKAQSDSGHSDNNNSKKLTQRESGAIEKIKNLLAKNLFGSKGAVQGAVSDMVGNPIPNTEKGRSYYHDQKLGQILGGLRTRADALKNSSDPDAIAAREQAQQAIQQIEDAIKGAGL